MINVTIISRDASKDVALLSQHADMKVSTISPTVLDVTLAQIGKIKADIIVIEHGIDDSNADILCYYINKRYPHSCCLILTDKTPTFEMLQNSGFKARGYLTSEQRPVLDKAIRVLQDGEAWLPRKLVTDMLNRFASRFIMADGPDLRSVG